MADSLVLDIATLIERPRIKVDGESYEILSPEELSVVEHQRFAAAGRLIDGLMAKASLSKKEEEKLAKAVDGLVERIASGVPPEVLAKLSGAQRLDVIEVFTGLLLRRKLTAAGAMRQWIGATPPPGSNGSTAGTRAGGSAKRPSPSSGPTS